MDNIFTVKMKAGEDNSHLLTTKQLIGMLIFFTLFIGSMGAVGLIFGIADKNNKDFKKEINAFENSLLTTVNHEPTFLGFGDKVGQINPTEELNENIKTCGKWSLKDTTFISTNSCEASLTGSWKDFAISVKNKDGNITFTSYTKTYTNEYVKDN